jgi:predicted nucleotidyltransferase component of viral defense system
MIEIRDIEKWTAKYRFNPDIIEKVYHMSEILYKMNEKDLMEQNLALKGGTAINLFYLDIPRLSVDLDFNYIGKIDKESMQNSRKSIENTLRRLGSSMGYEVIDKGSSYIISRMIFKYTRLSGVRDHVKVEINYLERMPMMDLVKKRMKPVLPFLIDVEVPVYALNELCAQKAVACVQRKLPRDIYDIHELSKLISDPKSIHCLAMIYHCMHANDHAIDLSFFDTMDMKRLRQTIQPYLREEIDYIKMVQTAKGFTSKIFELDDNSTEFLDSFFFKGMIQEGFLGNDLILNESPALLHKLRKL